MFFFRFCDGPFRPHPVLESESSPFLKTARHVPISQTRAVIFLTTARTDAPLRRFTSMSTDMAARLREFALRCSRLAREQKDQSLAAEFEGLSVELAEEAKELESLLTVTLDT
jgi:hypothetical protein